jgi:hypothetical protein
MAGGAVAFQRIVEEREALELAAREAYATGDEEVVLAVERPELPIFPLVLRECEAHPVERRVRRVKNAGAEHAAEFVDIGRDRELRDHRFHRRVRHFVRGEKRPLRLLGERRCASVAVESSAWCALSVEEERGIER